MKNKIIGPKMNIPWEDRPKDCPSPLWRYSKNPIIDRNPIKGVSRIFNSALLPYEDGYIGVFRGDTFTTIPYLYLGRSKDGIHFEFDEKPIEIFDENGNLMKFDYAYDPRLIEIEGTYYVSFCTHMHGPTVAVIKTNDFKKFTFVSIPLLPFNRNGVFFPRRINGDYLLLSRPSDNGHTPFGDIFLSRSKDMIDWGRHSHIMEAGYEWWCGLKVGAGCNPIETNLGWLCFVHGTTRTCNGYVYSIGAIILDRDDPSKVLYRCSPYLLTPEMEYETNGFVPNVCFPTCALADSETGRIAIYAGAADTYVELLFTDIDTVLDYIMKNSR